MTGNELILNDSFITLEREKHIYTDINGVRYKSVSRLLDHIKAPFDSDGISGFMAKSAAGIGASPQQVQVEKQKILNAWAKKGNDSSSYGTSVHDKLEQFMISGTSGDPKVDILGKNIYQEFCYGAFKVLPEHTFYDVDDKIAGTADLPVIRKKLRTNPWILDIFDYKTNIEKGIVFDSIERRKVPPKHPDRYMMGEFSHIESCNYFDYCMQLSIYAFMAQKRYGLRIGRLGIIFIDHNLNYRYIPVPYMFFEVVMLFRQYRGLKTLPEQSVVDLAPETVSSTLMAPFNFYTDDTFEGND